MLLPLVTGRTPAALTRCRKLRVSLPFEAFGHFRRKVETAALTLKYSSFSPVIRTFDREAEWRAFGCIFRRSGVGYNLKPYDLG